jgi:hypothetical protein
MVPSIWQCDCPNWILAMSLIGGCSIQPESLTTSLMSTGAPHSGQVGEFGSLGCRQKRQTYWFIGPARYSEAWWWTYMDWMPTRPGPVISARYMLCRISPVRSGSCTAFICTLES